VNGWGGGAVQVTTRDLGAGATATVTLREKFDADDHNVAGLLRRADGHLMAFYAGHHRDFSFGMLPVPSCGARAAMVAEGHSPQIGYTSLERFAEGVFPSP
jgi:hypothetical protein